LSATAPRRVAPVLARARVPIVARPPDRRAQALARLPRRAPAAIPLLLALARCVAPPPDQAALAHHLVQARAAITEVQRAVQRVAAVVGLPHALARPRAHILVGARVPVVALRARRRPRPRLDRRLTHPARIPDRPLAILDAHPID